MKLFISQIFTLEYLFPKSEETKTNNLDQLRLASALDKLYVYEHGVVFSNFSLCFFIKQLTQCLSCFYYQLLHYTGCL